MTDFYPSSLDIYPDVAKYVPGIPSTIRQGDSAQWVDNPFTDVQGVRYDSGGYTLKYTLAGPIKTPLVLTAAAYTNAPASWQTTLDTTDSATLKPGTYWYTAQAFATNVRITIAEGQFKVAPDLALAGANVDLRTEAEIGLANARAALAAFQASGRMQAYSIGSRHMTYQKDSDLLAVIAYWERRVRAERSAAVGGRDRLISQAFHRAR